MQQVVDAEFHEHDVDFHPLPESKKYINMQKCGGSGRLWSPPRCNYWPVAADSVQ